jgi:hypothetical protein
VFWHVMTRFVPNRLAGGCELVHTKGEGVSVGILIVVQSLSPDTTSELKKPRRRKLFPFLFELFVADAPC